MKYRLRDDGFASYKRIVIGRDVVGTVRKLAENSYLGTIKQHKVEGESERDAFEEVVARDLGYGCAADLHSRNRQIVARHKARKRAFDDLVRERGVMGAVSHILSKI